MAQTGADHRSNPWPRSSSSIIPATAIIGAALTSTVSQHGGQGTILTSLLHLGLTVARLPYSSQGQPKLDEVTGGNPYGAATIAPSDGSRRPGENELADASQQGRQLAQVAAKLNA